MPGLWWEVEDADDDDDSVGLLVYIEQSSFMALYREHNLGWFLFQRASNLIFNSTVHH